MSDKIIIKDASFLVKLGITEEEKKESQEIFIDIAMSTNTKKSAASDDIADTLDYFKIYEGLKNILENNKYNLIETVTEVTADYILKNFGVKKVKIRVKKPNALIGKAMHASVKIKREVS